MNDGENSIQDHPNGIIDATSQDRKPPAYWRNWDNLVNEIVIFINEIYNYIPHFTSMPKLKISILNALQTGMLEFPSIPTLNNAGQEKITKAFRYFGGITGVKKSLNIPNKTKPPKYWRNWNNYLSELLSFVLEFNNIKQQTAFTPNIILDQIRNRTLMFPKQSDFVTYGRHDLNHAAKNFGGLVKVKKRLNIPYKKKASPYKPPTKSLGYWQEWNNFLKELISFLKFYYNTPESSDLNIIQKLQKNTLNFPYVSIFKENAQNGLLNAFSYYGGFTGVKRRLKIPKEIRPPNYWQN